MGTRWVRETGATQERGALAMSAIPLYLQRRFEQRWAAKLASLVPRGRSHKHPLERAAKTLPRTAKAKEPAVLKQQA